MKTWRNIQGLPFLSNYQENTSASVSPLLVFINKSRFFSRVGVRVIKSPRYPDLNLKCASLTSKVQSQNSVPFDHFSFQDLWCWRWSTGIFNRQIQSFLFIKFLWKRADQGSLLWIADWNIFSQWKHRSHGKHRGEGACISWPEGHQVWKYKELREETLLPCSLCQLNPQENALINHLLLQTWLSSPHFMFIIIFLFSSYKHLLGTVNLEACWGDINKPKPCL